MNNCNNKIRQSINKNTPMQPLKEINGNCNKQYTFPHNLNNYLKMAQLQHCVTLRKQIKSPKQRREQHKIY